MTHAGNRYKTAWQFSFLFICRFMRSGAWGMKSFDGSLIYITGGSSGIGLEMAKIFAAQGADLLLIARNPQKLQDAFKSKSIRTEKIRKMREAAESAGKPES